MEELRPLLIAGLVMAEVALWQWRMVIAHRRHRAGAMVLGFVGAVLQITAITQVVTNVHDVFSVAAYAGGVGCGVLFGLIVGDRVTPGQLAVTIVSSVPHVSDLLWRRGWQVTAHHGHGHTGPATILLAEVDRRDAVRLRRDVEAVDPAARWSANELQAAS